jgi:peptidyl-tRNA hydrolase, PTH2 family
MTKGKVAAQCCHAVLAAYEAAKIQTPDLLKQWHSHGQAKITLKCPDEETMVKMMHDARKLGLVAQYIRDAGRTQIAPNSRTVLAIGPGPVDLINKVSGELGLY